ncbi:MAG: hypothetical protein GY711_08925 [bacterium]|nr:hypothetical protein [bacterium]
MLRILSRCLTLAAAAPLALAGAQDDAPPQAPTEGAPARPAARIGDVAWIAGSWTGEAFGGTFEEVWTPPTGGSMLGLFKLKRDGRPWMYEIQVIVEEEGSLVLKLKHFSAELHGWEEKDAFVSFPLVKIEDGVAQFDGLTFRRDGPDRMQVHLAVERNGERDTEEMMYVRGVPGGDAPAAEPVRERRLVSDFDGGELEASFGAGWAVSTDTLMGGTSSAQLTVVEAGARESSGALSITGTIEAGAAQTWAGAMFWPGPAPMAAADLSASDTLSFSARGSDGTYAVMVFTESGGFMPAMQPLSIGKEWKDYSLAIDSFGGTDGSDLTGIYFGAVGDPGGFELSIDDVLFEGPSSARAEAPAEPRVPSAPDPAAPIDNLVHPPGYVPTTLGPLGRVEIVGSGSVTLILLPGFGFDAEIFRAFAAANHERYSMVLVTPAGFGSTAAPPMPAVGTSYADQSWGRALEAEVLALASRLRLGRPVLVGFAGGAQHALRIAIEHPDRIAGVVSICGEPYRDFGQPVTAEGRARMIDTRMAQQWFKSVSAETWAQGMGQPAWYSADEAAGSALYEASLVASIPTMVRYFCEQWSYDPRHALEGYSIPTLALLPDAGTLTEDATYQQFVASALVGPWEELAKDRDPIETQAIAGSRMGMLVDQTGAVSAEVARFVDALHF